ncbi:MAG: alanine racemase, partial [Hyphomicrobiales bacterium]|nr:alanine racemase [Hyphomicrobiales bacterium]
MPATGAQGRLTIDLSALRANWRALAERARPAETAAVVKADAYGLGAARVAPALWREGARTFFVALLSEAAALRDVLPDGATIYALNGCLAGDEAAHAALRARPVLNSLAEIRDWARFCAARGERLPAAIQLDSGMSRLGLSPAEVEALARDPSALAAFDLALAMSHLACADAPAHPANAAQRAAFVALAAKLPATKLSLANSAGIFLGRDYAFDLVRPGVALYGADATDSAAARMAP